MKYCPQYLPSNETQNLGDTSQDEDKGKQNKEKQGFQGQGHQN